MDVDDFINVLPDRFNASMPFNYRVKNWQAFELGMDHLNEDLDYVRQSLAKLDKQFDLVIVIEYYDESMVLLAQLLCVPYEVIWMEALNPRDYVKPSLEPELMDKFNKHFRVDIAVYEHFKQVLLKKIDKFGKSRMATEVAKMKEVFNACNKNKKLCRFKSKPIVPQQTKEIKPTLQYYIDQADSGFGYCPYSKSPYQMAKRYLETGKLAGCSLHKRFLETKFQKPAAGM